VEDDGDRKPFRTLEHRAAQAIEGGDLQVTQVRLNRGRPRRPVSVSDVISTPSNSAATVFREQRDSANMTWHPLVEGGVYRHGL